jgi:hypothetical protein
MKSHTHTQITKSHYAELSLVSYLSQQKRKHMTMDGKKKEDNNNNPSLFPTPYHLSQLFLMYASP